jgi:predicted N-acetyltransferase YhbS
MTTRHRKYRGSDFWRIRDLLVRTCRAFGPPLNWGIERWNYARYLVAPYLSAYGKDTPTADGSEGIRAWEEAIEIWEDGNGAIVGAVHTETPWLGSAWFQRHPQHTDLLGEMLDHAERTLVDETKHTLHISILEHDEPLHALARARGYVQDTAHPEPFAEFAVDAVPAPHVPEGFVVRSMADENDVERRREVYGRAFNHSEPSEWPQALVYRELQNAPDYCRDLDLYVVGPQGAFVACCIVWYDADNRIGYLEPVGTHPDFRRKGLGRAVVMEGIRRAAALGATAVRVGSGQPFYLAIGFQIRHTGYGWTKTF